MNQQEFPKDREQVINIYSQPSNKSSDFALYMDSASDHKLN